MCKQRFVYKSGQQIILYNSYFLHASQMANGQYYTVTVSFLKYAKDMHILLF